MTPNMIVTLAAERNQLFASEVASARLARQCRPPSLFRLTPLTSLRLWLCSRLIAIGTFFQSRPGMTLTNELVTTDSR